MSNQVRGRDASGSAGPIADVGYGGEQSVTLMGPALGATGGRYRHVATTGATTAIAALSNAGTNGIHWACRFAPASSTKLCLVEKIFAQYTSTVGPSTAQQTGVVLFRASAFTAIPTSGTAATLTTPQTKLRTSEAVPELLISAEDTTSEMTAGTHTLDTVPLAALTRWHLAAGATVQMPNVDLDLDFTASPLVLAANEGLLLGPAVTQANSLAQVCRVMIQWREVLAYGQ